MGRKAQKLVSTLSTTGNIFSETVIMTVYGQLKVSYLFDEIVVRKPNENSSGFEFEIKKLEDIQPDDTILIIVKDEEEVGRFYNLTFINNGEYGRKIEQYDEDGVEEYLDFIIKDIEKRYGHDEVVVSTIFENPMMTLIPNVELLSQDEVKELFKKYINNYLGLTRQQLESAMESDDRKSIKLNRLFGEEFEKAFLGEYKIPLWVTSPEDVFASLKTELLNKLVEQDINLNTISCKPEHSKYFEYYEKRSYSIPYRIKMFTKGGQFRNYATWTCIDPCIFKSSNVEKITDIVNLL